jgi:hypothetical protein
MAVSQRQQDDLDLDAAMELRRMLAGGWIAQSLYLVTRLGVPDRLDGGPQTSADLAAATGVDHDALHRILRVLASTGVFAIDEQGRFGLTRLGRCLRTGHPGTLGALAIWNGQVGSRVWQHADHSLRTGLPASAHALGMPMFEYLQREPELGAVFGQAMAGIARQVAGAVIDAYDFAPFGTVVDVGGGSGTLLSAILRSSPGSRGVLFDLPGVTEAAAGALREARVGDRCDVVAGDFFTSVPAGGDAYVLSSILHDWSGEDAERILRACRRAMSSESTLLVIECVRDRGGEPGFEELLDLQMLIMTGGRERTESEYADLLRRTGFRVTRHVDLRCPESLIEARPE